MGGGSILLFSGGDGLGIYAAGRGASSECSHEVEFDRGVDAGVSFAPGEFSRVKFECNRGRTCAGKKKKKIIVDRGKYCGDAFVKIARKNVCKLLP